MLCYTGRWFCCFWRHLMRPMDIVTIILLLRKYHLLLTFEEENVPKCSKQNNTVVCGLEYWILSVLQEEDSSMLTAEAAGKLSFISVPLSAGDESHVSGQEQSVTHLQQSVSTLDRLDIQCLCLYGFYLLLYKLSRLENFLILFSVTS
ncbi:uncharacterized protein LOC131051665 isoform X1 [Cryptomeria japonica]|uniref:uncharacterized protein LOC131051665 isoform X1 n=1 Tax=Cryptomeria japonica TaxID=3369 RepID=UPI0025ACCAE9|nr:uncharacterized protein LOC131051665 isoform X1 [Cryptomeria japonica]XP_059068111.1 uncharacterized protein LOC131051665 isoform X1 [Cryptomeria japonica]